MQVGEHKSTEKEESKRKQKNQSPTNLCTQGSHKKKMFVLIQK